MIPVTMMPIDIDVVEMINELHSIGWRDQKIELACGFSQGYIAKVKAGPRPARPGQAERRLWNFWVHEFVIPHGHTKNYVYIDSANRQTVVVTTAST